MKKISSILFAILISFSLLNAQTFEGIVNFKTTNADGDIGEFKYFGKDNKIRMEMMSDEMGSVIFNGNKTIILIPAEKSYMEFSNDMMKQLGGMMKEDDEDSSGDLPKKTGETKTILGYECTKWTYDDGTSLTELWITEELGNYIIPSTPMTPAPEWAGIFDGKPFFPLLIITKENGKISDQIEVTKIEKKSLSDSEFIPPSDFKKLDMSKMMGN